MSYKSYTTPTKDFIQRTTGPICSDDINARELIFILFSHFESDLPLTRRLKTAIDKNKIGLKRINEEKLASHTSIIYSDTVANSLRTYIKDVTSEHRIELRQIKEQNLREASVLAEIIQEVNFLKRFKVAFSFPGDHRDKIKAIVNILLQKYGLTEDNIMFDEFHKAEFSGPDLAPYLQKLYHDHSEVIVVLLCQEYQKKPWCFNIEWRAINDLIINRKGDIMYLSVGNPEIVGIYTSQDGIIYWEKETPEGCAKMIYDRINGKGRMNI